MFAAVVAKSRPGARGAKPRGSPEKSAAQGARERGEGPGGGGGMGLGVGTYVQVDAVDVSFMATIGAKR